MCQPVMFGGFQSDDAGLRLPMKKLHQTRHALLRVLEQKEAANPLAVRIEQTDLAGTLANINVNQNRGPPPKADFCGRAIPDSMRAYSPVCDAWPNHNQLICSPSHEGDSVLLCQALSSERLSAAGSSHATEFTPQSMGFQI